VVDIAENFGRVIQLSTLELLSSSLTPFSITFLAIAPKRGKLASSALLRDG
jgi:hypothetical protein